MHHVGRQRINKPLFSRAGIADANTMYQFSAQSRPEKAISVGSGMSPEGTYPSLLLFQADSRVKRHWVLWVDFRVHAALTDSARAIAVRQRTAELMEVSSAHGCKDESHTPRLPLCLCFSFVLHTARTCTCRSEQKESERERERE